MISSSPLLDLSYLNKVVAGDPEIRLTILSMLIVEFDEAVPQLQELWRQKDWPELARFCHHFKSTLSYTGDAQLDQANSYIWEYAKNGGSDDPSSLQVHIDLIVSQSAWVKDQLQLLIAPGS